MSVVAYQPPSFGRCLTRPGQCGPFLRPTAAKGGKGRAGGFECGSRLCLFLGRRLRLASRRDSGVRLSA